MYGGNYRSFMSRNTSMEFLGRQKWTLSTVFPNKSEELFVSNSAEYCLWELAPSLSFPRKPLTRVSQREMFYIDKKLLWLFRCPRNYHVFVVITRYRCTFSSIKTRSLPCWPIRPGSLRGPTWGCSQCWERETLERWERNNIVMYRYNILYRRSHILHVACSVIVIPCFK